MKVGGQILWNVTPICETSQIYYLMGRRPMKDVLGNLFKDQSFHLVSLVEYHPITAKDQSRIHQFGKKVLPGLFLGYALYAGWIWKGDILVADIEELETMDASEIYSKKDSTQRKQYFHQENGKLIFPAVDGRIKLSGGDQELRTPTLRRKSQRFSWRIRTVSSSTSRLTSGCRWSDKWLLVHVKKLHFPPSRWTKSQTLLAERRIIPYWNTLTHPELQERIWMLCTNAASMTIGISMGQEISLVLGQISSLCSLY